MNINQSLMEMNCVSPPVQPVLDARAEGMRQMLVDWNHNCAKSKALFYQFVASEKKCPFPSLIPDACVNFLFKCDSDDPGAIFSGIVTNSFDVELEDGKTYFGVKPYSMLGTTFSRGQCADLVDSAVPVRDVFRGSDRLIDNIAGPRTFEERVLLFMDYANANLLKEDYKPSFLDYFSVLLCIRQGELNIREIEDLVGYSPRYCREQFKSAHGISPKRYSAIIQFQTALKGLTLNAHDITTTAFNNGYYDQSHFIRSFKEYTNVSPDVFRKTLNNAV